MPSAVPAACAISVVPPCAGGAHLPLDQGGVAGSVVRCGARDRAVVTGVAGDGPEPGREAAACSGYDVKVGVLPPFHMLSDSAGLMSWHVVRLAMFVGAALEPSSRRR